VTEQPNSKADNISNVVTDSSDDISRNKIDNGVILTMFVNKLK